MLTVENKYYYTRFFYALAMTFVTNQMGWLWERVATANKTYAQFGLLEKLPIMEGAGLDTVFMCSCLFALFSSYRPDLWFFRLGFLISFGLLSIVNWMYWGSFSFYYFGVLFFALAFVVFPQLPFLEKLGSIPLYFVFVILSLAAIPAVIIFNDQRVNTLLIWLILPMIFVFLIPALNPPKRSD